MADRKPAVNDGDARRYILQLLLEHNLASATSIADTLGLSTTNIRCRIDILVDEGLAKITSAPSTGPRGRGRPAKSYHLVDRSCARFGHVYDNLTSAALTALHRTGGKQAAAQFACQRIDDILLGVTPVGQDAEKEEVVEAVVDASRRVGYAATINRNTGSVQICQHHYPIGHIASGFPELCAAKHEAASRLSGQHAQPLATIADGSGICTTNTPLIPVTEVFTKSSQERNGE